MERSGCEPIGDHFVAKYIMSAIDSGIRRPRLGVFL